MYMELKKRREEMNLTQRELSEKCNIPYSSYQSYELGLRKPNVDVAVKIARALKCEVSELFK